MPATLTRTDSSDAHFHALVDLLNAELAEIDGEEHEFYSQFNAIDQLKHVVIAFENDSPIACGAMKPFGTESMEIKRMYTRKSSRGQGIGAQVLSELEAWAAALGFKSCVLETGDRQPDAVALYSKMGYNRIENYGQYKGIINSICFKKSLSLQV